MSSSAFIEAILSGKLLEDDVMLFVPHTDVCGTTTKRRGGNEAGNKGGKQSGGWRHIEGRFHRQDPRLMQSRGR